MYPLIHTTGSPFEQGVNQGKSLHAEIFKNLDLYFYRFQHECCLKKDEVLNRAGRYLPKLKSQNQDYYAGMLGIASGCGADLLEIVALNVRYEILYYQYAIKGLADGCTSIAVTNKRTTEQHTLLAQNWDWFPETAGAVIHAEHENGVSSLAFTEAGIFGGKIGLNSAGIGLLINGLISLQDDWSTLEKPFHLRCYEILQQETFQNAIDIVTDEPRACSANFVIGSANGKIFDIEAAPQTFAVHTPQNGVLVHTNHFLDPAGLDVSEPAEERIHTEHRYDRAIKISSQNNELVSQKDIKNWLSDHDGHPNSICQHRDPELPDYEQYESVASFLLNLSTQTLAITYGPPCSANFQEFNLAGENSHVQLSN